MNPPQRSPFADKYTCPKCKQVVNTGYSTPDALGCDGPCGRCYHRACTDLTVTQYHNIIANETQWICAVCTEESIQIESQIRQVQQQLPTETDIECDVYPEYEKANNQQSRNGSRLKWGNMTGFDEINKVLSDAYNEVLKFNKNMFKVPYGRIGKSVVTETCKLITLYNENANREGLALKAVFLFLPLFL